MLFNLFLGPTRDELCEKGQTRFSIFFKITDKMYPQCRYGMQYAHGSIFYFDKHGIPFSRSDGNLMLYGLSNVWLD